MSHNIETFDSGFLTDRAWHNHPSYVVTGEVITADQVQSVAFTPITPMISATFPDGTVVDDVDNLQVFYRPVVMGDGTTHYHKLSHMSGTYTGLSYEETFGAIAQVMIDNDIPIKTVGTLQNGGKMFLLAHIPGLDLEFPGWSDTQQWLNFGDSLNGTSLLRATQSMHAVVCGNTFAAYILGADPLFKIRHTKNAQAVANSALQSLDASIKLSKDIQAAVEQLCNDPFSEADFLGLLRHDDICGERPDVGKDGRTTGQTHYDNVFDAMVDRYHEDDIEGIRETKFGALMAIQGYEQHVGRANKSTSNPTGSKDVQHLDKLMFKGQALTEAASKILVGA